MKNRTQTTMTAVILSWTLAGCFGGGNSESVEISLAADPMLEGRDAVAFSVRPRCGTIPGVAWWVAQDGTLLEEHYEGVEDPAFDDELGPGSEVPSGALPAAFQQAAESIREANAGARPGPRPDPEPALTLGEIPEMVERDSRDHDRADDSATVATGRAGKARTLHVRIPDLGLSAVIVTTDPDLDLLRIARQVFEVHGVRFPH